jgi:ribosomal protein S18 acetylase RimI-like enzyme
MGFAGACDGPYLWPMLKACVGEFLISLMRNPVLLADSRLWRRLLFRHKALDRQARRILNHPGMTHLTTGAVDASFRGKGIIGTLVEALTAISRSRGSKGLCVGVRPTNHAIRRSFVKLGWAEVPASESSEMVYYITCLDPDPPCSN